METLQVNTKLAMETTPDFDDSFMNHPMSSSSSASSSSCPPSSASSFSASSSVYDPFSPTSGRSTPGHSIDLDPSSIDHLHMNMDISPPPPHHHSSGNCVPGYFGSAVETGAATGGGIMADSPFLGTSMKRHHAAQNQHALAMNNAAAAPSNLEYCSMLEMHHSSSFDGLYPAAHLSTASFMDMSQGSMDGGSADSMTAADMCSMHHHPYHHHQQHHHQWDSPLSHKSISPAPASSGLGLKMESPEPHIPSMQDKFQGMAIRLEQQQQNHHGVASLAATPAARRRAALNQVRQKTVAMKQVTTKDDSPAEDEDEDMTYMSIDCKRVSKPNHKCGHCEKSYSRKEHLKRHVQSKHNSRPVYWECEFCDDKREKPFNRFDNYRTHISHHANPERQKGNGRVQFNKEAPARYEELLRQTKVRKNGRAAKQRQQQQHHHQQQQQQQLKTTPRTSTNISSSRMMNNRRDQSRYEPAAFPIFDDTKYSF